MQSLINPAERIKINNTTKYEGLTKYIRQYEDLVLNRHQIDRAKSVGDEVFQDSLIQLCTQKIQKGIQLVEFMMSERLWFFQEMQQNEDNILESINYLRSLSEEVVKDDSINNCSQIKEDIKQRLIGISKIMIRINTSLMVNGKELMKQTEWRDQVADQYKNNVHLKENICMNLKQSARSLFSFFKCKRNALKLLIDNEQREDLIVKFIEFVEFFMYELETQVPLQFMFLFHLWIEDLITQQARYEANIALETNFQIDYFRAHNLIMLQIKKCNRSIDNIINENASIVERLNSIQLPSVNLDHLNTQMECYHRIHKTQHNIYALLDDTLNLQMAPFHVYFLFNKNSQTDKSDENEKDQKFEGAFTLKAEEVNILYSYRQDQSNKIRVKLQDVQFGVSGIKLLINKLNDLWLAEKKYRSSEKEYNKCVILTRKTTADINRNDNISQDKNVLFNFVLNSDKLIMSSTKLQMDMNMLTYYLNIIRQMKLRQIVRLIGEIEVFIIKSQLLLENLSLNLLQQIINAQEIWQNRFPSESVKVKQGGQVYKAIQCLKRLNTIKIQHTGEQSELEDSDTEFDKLLEMQNLCEQQDINTDPDTYKPFLDAIKISR